MKRSTFRRTVREGDRGEPQRLWVAWMEPVAGCVPALGTARLAKVSQNASELELSLRNMGVRVGRFSSQSKALAWLDDEKLRCSACGDGKGRWRCPSCQEGILVGQLERSVGGCCR